MTSQTLIHIRERAATGTGFEVELTVDGDGPYVVSVRDPFQPAEEARLEW